jgi:uncharacterized protein YndB with AHSA1/START domain
MKQTGSEDAKNPTSVERVSDCELVTTRSFDAPLSLVYEAWTQADLFKQWWVPPSFGLTLLSCEMDVRTGGRYRLEFGHPASDQPIAFFGTYIDVVPNALIIWTNEESGKGRITSVTFEARDGQTQVVMRDTFPNKEALDKEIEEMDGVAAIQFAELDALLVTLAVA